METVLVFAIVAIAIGGGFWVWSARPPEGEEAPALPPVRGVAFAQHVVEALQARGVGVTAADVDGVELSNGRRLPLAALKSRFARAGSQEERRALVEQQIEDWSVMGHILTIDELRRRVIEVFEAEGLQPAIDPDDPFAIDTATGSFSLRRLLSDVQAGPLDGLDDRIAHLVVQLKIMADTPESWDQVKDEVLPRAVPCSRIDWEEHQDLAAMAMWVAPGVAVKVALSRQGVHRYMDPLLTEWGVSFEDAFEAAFTNQAAMGLPAHFCEEAPGAVLSKFADHRDANVYLIPDEAFEQLPLVGDPVVFALEESLVYVTGADDLDGLRLCVDEAIKVLRTNVMTLHPAPLVRVGPARWEPFQPDEDHPLHGVIAWLHRIHQAREAEGTRPLLIERFPEVFVAIPAASGPGEKLVTWCTWPPFETVLPQTESIVVVDADFEGWVAPAEEVRRLAGDVVAPVEGLRTPWWHARDGFPEDKMDELRAIGWSMGRVEPEMPL